MTDAVSNYRSPSFPQSQTTSYSSNAVTYDFTNGFSRVTTSNAGVRTSGDGFESDRGSSSYNKVSANGLGYNSSSGTQDYADVSDRGAMVNTRAESGIGRTLAVRNDGSTNATRTTFADQQVEDRLTGLNYFSAARDTTGQTTSPARGRTSYVASTQQTRIGQGEDYFNQFRSLYRSTTLPPAGPARNLVQQVARLTGTDGGFQIARNGGLDTRSLFSFSRSNEG